MVAVHIARKPDFSAIFRSVSSRPAIFLTTYIELFQLCHGSPLDFRNVTAVSLRLSEHLPELRHISVSS